LLRPLANITVGHSRGEAS